MSEENPVETILEAAESELHDIKNKRRPRAVREKKGGVALRKRRKMSASKKAVAAVCGVLVAATAAFGVNALFKKREAIPIDLDYGSVMYPLESGETFEEGKYTGEEIFGRLNWQFRQHPHWYADVHGTVFTPIGEQDVRTYKRYNEGILISADVTKSSMVNAAREFCYIESIDRVVWREAAGNSSTYNGLDTPWITGTPTANMYINHHEPDLNGNGKCDPEEDTNGNGILDTGFKATRGLPAYELSVYVIRPETIADDGWQVVNNGDGTYTLQLNLKPEITQNEETGGNEGAPAYYANQMIFTGGLSDVPVFKEIHASFTFDENFNTVRTNIEEAYTATMGVTVNCSAVSQTDYDYEQDVSGIVNDIFTGYFEPYMQMEATGAPDPVLDGKGALGMAFAPVLEKPTTLKLDLNIDGTPVEGIVYVDLHTGGAIPSFEGEGLTKFLNDLEVRAKIGSVQLYLKSGTAYLSVGDLKVKLTVSELMDLFKGEETEGSEAKSEGDDPLNAIMNAAVRHVEGSGKASSHVELDLGSVVIPIDFNYFINEEKLQSEKKFDVSLDSVHTEFAVAGIGLEATIGFTDAEAPAEIEGTEDYVELTSHIKDLVSLFTAGAVKGTVNYAGGGLTVKGDLNVVFDPLAVKADVTLHYQSLEKKVSVLYTDGTAYLTIDGLNVRADVNRVVGLIGDLMGTKENKEATSVLSKVLGLENFSSLVSVQGGDNLQILIQATDLLNAFGVNLALGEVSLTVSGGTIDVKAEGIGLKSLHIDKGSKEAPEIPDAVDLTPVIEKIPAILNAQEIALKGAINIAVKDTEVALIVKEGLVSWKDGVEVYLDAAIDFNGTRIPLKLAVKDKAFDLSVAGVRVRLASSDLSDIEAKLFEVYAHVRDSVNEMIEGSDPLPELSKFSDLTNALQGLGIAVQAAEEAEEDGAFDWTELVNEIGISSSEKEGGLLHLAFKGIELDLCNEPDQDGLVGLYVEFGSSDFAVTGEFHAAVSEKAFPEIAGDAFGKDQFITLIDYLGTAVELLDTTDLTLSFTGTVTSTDPAYGTYGGVKYDITASMETHRENTDENGNKKGLLHIDVDGKNLWVDSSIYAHASINVRAQNSADTSLFIDLFIVDGAPKDTKNGTVAVSGEAEKDGNLDFYVTLSQYGDVNSNENTVLGYNPVRLYAPADEILTILSAALPMLGVDVDILNNYMVNKWLSLDNIAQLKALTPLVGGLLGENVQKTVADVSGLLNQLFGDKKDAQADTENGEGTPAAKSRAAKAEPSEFSLADYFTFSIDEGKLKIELASDKLYGKTGLNNVVATLTREAQDEKPEGNSYARFTSLNLQNIYGNDCRENTSLQGTIGYEEITPALPTGEYRSFLGAEKLILSLVKSATHEVKSDEVISGEEAQHTYAVNNNFYIDGSATIKLHLGGLKLTEITIRVIAISVTVDENGELGINIRLAYDGARMAVTLINGNSTVDLTIKGGMVYMKRVQTTYYKTATWTDWSSGWRDCDPPIILYRVTPLGSFTADILDHIGFILNFGDTITNALGSAMGSGSGSTTTSTKVDFGKRLSDVLASYNYTEEVVENNKITTPAAWDLTINGDALAKGVLGNLNITIAENSEGYIRDITASTSVVSIIDATVSLHWRNPGGTMEEGVTDQTHDIVSEDKLDDKASGFGGMTEKLLAQGWGTEDYAGFATFLEGQRHTVTFKHNGSQGEETLGTQEVIVSTGADSYAERAVYSALNYPDISDSKYAPADQLQVMGWTEFAPGTALPSDYVVWTQAHGHPVEVTSAQRQNSATVGTMTKRKIFGITKPTCGTVRKLPLEIPPRR